MKKHIVIDELDNGYLIKFFAEYPSDKKFDKNVFCQLWIDVEKTIRKWISEVDKQ